MQEDSAEWLALRQFAVCYISLYAHDLPHWYVTLWYPSVKLYTTNRFVSGIAVGKGASLNTSNKSNPRKNLFSYLVSVSFGIFVDFCQGQVGVEFISVFLQEEQHSVKLDSNVKQNLNPWQDSADVVWHLVNTLLTLDSSARWAFISCSLRGGISCICR